LRFEYKGVISSSAGAIDQEVGQLDKTGYTLTVVGIKIDNGEI